jgi:hypothetical protein
MKASYECEVATHIGPESRRGAREGEGSKRFHDTKYTRLWLSLRVQLTTRR